MQRGRTHRLLDLETSYKRTEKRCFCSRRNANFFYFLFSKERVNPPCEMTERRMFIMAKQVASALVSVKQRPHLAKSDPQIPKNNQIDLDFFNLFFPQMTHPSCVNPEYLGSIPKPVSLHNQEFLHSKGLLHGHVCARSVLVSREFTAKLWGLHGVYTRKSQGAARRDDASVKKWQAPEILAKRPAGPSSDM